MLGRGEGCFQASHTQPAMANYFPGLCWMLVGLGKKSEMSGKHSLVVSICMHKAGHFAALCVKLLVKAARYAKHKFWGNFSRILNFIFADFSF